MAEYTGASYISPPIKKALNGKFNNPATTFLDMSNNNIVNCHNLTLTQDGSGGITFADGTYQDTAGGGGSATPGGPTNSIQYNNGLGGMAGSANLMYDDLTTTLNLSGTFRPTAINFNTTKIAISGMNTIDNQGINAVAIGYQAGKSNQSSNAVAIGYQAGQTGQGINAVAIGYQAGQTGQSSYALSVGTSAGQTSQGNNAVAVGRDAGQTSQGINSVALGISTGQTSQGNYSVAIGSFAAFTDQSNNAVAIGRDTGQTSQGQNAVALGTSAGFSNQGSKSVAIGIYSGLISQGSDAIAIGQYAGQTSQAANSIILNASGSELNQTTANTFTVKPVRNEPAIESYSSLYYESTTGEIVYGVASGNFSTPSTQLLDMSNNNIINVQNIQFSSPGISITKNIRNNQGANSIAIGNHFDNGTSYNGAIDLTFYENMGAGCLGGSVQAIAVDASANIIAGGNFTSYAATPCNRIIKLRPDGTIDPTFYENMGQGIGGTVYAIGVDSSANIIVGGSFTSYDGSGCSSIIKVRLDGTIDPIFYENMGEGIQWLFSGGTVNAIAVDASANIIVGGAFIFYDGSECSNIIKLRPDGTIDPTFYENMGAGCLGGSVQAIAVDASANIIVGGDFTSYAATPCNRIIKLRLDGTIDPTFYENMGAGFQHIGFASTVQAIAVDASANIIVGGDFTFYDGSGCSSIIKLRPDGTIDPIFYENMDLGMGGSNPLVYAIAVDASANIIVGGNFTSYDGLGCSDIIKLRPDGTIDPTFYENMGQGIGGSSVRAIGVDASANIIVGGNFTSYDGSGCSNIVKLAGNDEIIAGQQINAIAIGLQSGYFNQGQNAVAIGINAGSNTQGFFSVALGTNAGYSNQGTNAIAIGTNAGQTSQYGYSVAIGYSAGITNQHSSAVAIGNGAGYDTQQATAVAIGYGAGEASQQASAVAIGNLAGYNTQQTNAVAIGNLAGQTTQQTNAVAIGNLAGNENQLTNAVAIGTNAGQTSQFGYAVAIGYNAANSYQKEDSVALGTNAGYEIQGSNSVALGHNAGYTNQSSFTVAIGNNAGYTSQSEHAVAIGTNAGQTSQYGYAVAIGRNAGNNEQGTNAVAIGYGAGETSQAANSIILNATGSALDQTTANTFTVKPVRNEPIIDASYSSLFYNTTTGEIVSGTGGGGGGGTPGAPTNALQYNDGAGGFAGSSNLLYDDSLTTLSLTGTLDMINNSVINVNQVNFNDVGVYIGQGVGNSANSLLIGYQAGLNGGAASFAMGTNAGGNQGQYCFAMGTSAGIGQGNNAMAVGNFAGNSGQGEQTLAFGPSAGKTNQGNGAMAFGNLSGEDSQGGQCIAIGNNAGRFTQQPNAIAIGILAGQNTQGTDSIAIGKYAGVSTQGQNAVAIGNLAGSNTQGSYSIAIGSSAGNNEQGTNAVAIGNLAGETSQGANSIILNASGSALDQTTPSTFTVKPVRNESIIDASYSSLFYNTTTGEIVSGTGGGGGGGTPGAPTNALQYNDGAGGFAGSSNLLYDNATQVMALNGTLNFATGGNTIALTAGGANSGQYANAIAIGNGAGQTTQNINTVAIGFNAGQTTQYDNAVAIGNSAGNFEQYINAVAIGNSAGQTSQQDSAVAIGNLAGNNSQGSYSVAIGHQAGQTIQGGYSVAIGNKSGKTDQMTNSVAIGHQAGQTSQKGYAVAIGYQAGTSNQAASAVAIGNYAGYTGQSENAIAIGNSAGYTGQSNNAIGIGYWAGQSNQKEFAVAIGDQAGTSNQGPNAVAIGNQAGWESQQICAVAIGYGAGLTNQWDYAVAIGTNAGNGTQGKYTVAIGYGAGLNAQGYSVGLQPVGYSVAIGSSAGEDYQKPYAVAIGASAGQSNQGCNSVAIGYGAGLNNQAANSIILNATGLTLNQSTANTFTVKPIRNAGTNVSSNVLTYASGTGEITYGTKTFVIDHPLDKEKYLVHACLEGPEAGVYYRGTSFILPEAAFCEITLPHYADALANNFTVHITPVAEEASSVILTASRVTGGKFKVYQKKSACIWNKAWQRLTKKTAEPQYFDYIVFGKRAPLETEPLKANVELKGQGPYTWL
jgi:hypothetical protein